MSAAIWESRWHRSRWNCCATLPRVVTFLSGAQAVRNDLVDAPAKANLSANWQSRWNSIFGSSQVPPHKLVRSLCPENQRRFRAVLSRALPPSRGGRRTHILRSEQAKPVASGCVAPHRERERIEDRWTVAVTASLRDAPEINVRPRHVRFQPRQGTHEFESQDFGGYSRSSTMVAPAPPSCCGAG